MRAITRTPSGWRWPPPPTIRIRARNQERYPFARVTAGTSISITGPARIPQRPGTHHTMAARHMGEGEGVAPKRTAATIRGVRPRCRRMAPKPLSRSPSPRIIPLGSRTPRTSWSPPPLPGAPDARISRAPRAAWLPKQPSGDGAR